MLLHFLQQYVDLSDTIVEKLSLDDDGDEEEDDDQVMCVTVSQERFGHLVSTYYMWPKTWHKHSHKI